MPAQKKEPIGDKKEEKKPKLKMNSKGEIITETEQQEEIKRRRENPNWWRENE